MNKGFRFQNRKLFTFTGKEERVINVACVGSDVGSCVGMLEALDGSPNVGSENSESERHIGCCFVLLKTR